MGEVAIKEATLEQLGLDKINFPEGFTPRWYAGDEGRGCYVFWVSDEKPAYDEMEYYWYNSHTYGEWCEIGYFDEDDSHISSVYGTAPHPRDTLIRIIGEEL